jgi:hypothetical protein
MLRFMAWLCLKDDALSGSQMCIVTGPRIDLAIGLIDRMKKLFQLKLGIIFDTRETVIELNNVRIEAFPSHHLDAMRGLPNVSSFEREYNLKYLGMIGNVFHTKDIEVALEKGDNYNPPSNVDEVNYYTQKSMGIDPGFGSSASVL